MDSSPRRERERRRRPPPDDVESPRLKPARPPYASPTTPSKHGHQSYSRPYPSPGTPVDDSSPMMASTREGDLSRKKSLIRPERNRIDRDHPNYHYRKHAQNMPVHPSTTGNDPISEDQEVITINSDSTEHKPLPGRGQRSRRNTHLDTVLP